MAESKAQPNNLAAYSWSIADLLRGDFKQSQYGRIILPFTLLQERRTALISAAVTGKIDVRHWQSPAVSEPTA